MKRPPIGHLLGYTALTIVLTAGAAQSLSGSNTVFTDDIVDGQVTYADIKNGAVGSAKLRDNVVTGAKILDRTIKAQDIEFDSITGNKISERTIQTEDIDQLAVTKSEMDLVSVTNTIDPLNDSQFVGEATCPPEGLYEAIAGYGQIVDAQGAVIALTSFGSSGDEQNAWQMTWTVDGGLVDPESISVTAVCLQK